MKVYVVVTNSSKYKNETIRIINKLSKDFTVSVNREDSYRLFGNYFYHAFEIKNADYIISIGGDGTFLRACKLSINNKKKVFGISIGRRGYLCNFKKGDTINETTLNKLKFRKEILLKTKYGIACNDIIIGKDNFGGTIELALFIDGKQKYSLMGDGIIVSTPIGSSGYTSSAGGKIIKKGIIITPICPIEKIKPIVVKENSKIVIQNINKEYKSSIYIDGTRIESLDNSISIKKDVKNILVY